MLGHWRPLVPALRARRQGGRDLWRRVSRRRARWWAPIGLVVWILVFALFRYASVSSIVAAISLPVASVVLGEPWPVDVFAGAAALAVIVLHRPNIARLRAGTETRFRFRRPAQPVKS